MKRRDFIAAALGAVLLPGVGWAQVAAPSQALLMLRILAFDRKLAARAHGTVRIVVLFRSTNPASVEQSTQVLQALEAAGAKASVAGLPVKASALAYGPAFEQDLEKSEATAVYVCGGLDDVLATVVTHSRSQRRLTFTGNEPYVTSGVAVGLVQRDKKAGILVNLKASRAEGADFDSGLLNMAEVIR